MPTIPSPEAWPEFWTGFAFWGIAIVVSIVVVAAFGIRERVIARRAKRGNWPKDPRR